MKPLDVKTKFYNAESDEVFLEAQVNISFCLVHFTCLESGWLLAPCISFEPMHIFYESPTGLASY